MTNATPPRRIVKDLPLTRLLPNMLTLMSLCSGLTAMRFATQDKFGEAVIAVFVASIFDVLDGRVARMLNITSKFGAELDSLSDAISFGVAPAFVLYEWTLKDSTNFGWLAVLLYAVCGALRLARFNTMLEDTVVLPWAKKYFTGVPAPGGAGLALLPLFAFLEFGESVRLPPFVIAFWLMLVGGLMVSRVPTLALKGWRVTPIWVVPIFITVVLLVAELVTDPWLTLFAIGVIYLISMPVGWYMYFSNVRKEGKLNVSA